MQRGMQDVNNAILALAKTQCKAGAYVTISMGRDVFTEIFGFTENEEDKTTSPGWYTHETATRTERCIEVRTHQPQTHAK